MRLEGDRAEKAKAYLNEAARMEKSAEVLLGYAAFFHRGPGRDPRRAKSYYVRAALLGRFQGFFGYSKISRELGQLGRAALVDVVRILVGPFLALVLGARARGSF